MNKIFWIGLLIWIFWDDITIHVKNNVEQDKINQIVKTLGLKTNSNTDQKTKQFSADGSVNWDAIEKQEENKWK